MLTAMLLGCLLGLRHAGDPDHVAAISTLVARQRRPARAAWLGAAWGLGHGVTILLVGASAILLQVAVPARILLSVELVVGGMLVALGVSNLWAAHGVYAGGGTAEATAGRGRVPPRLLRSCCIGIVHGLAGSAAVALLALAAMPSPGAALAYLAVFALGTIAGMAAISVGIGVPFALAGRSQGAPRLLVAGSGALSLGLGLYLVYEFGIAHGLL